MIQSQGVADPIIRVNSGGINARRRGLPHLQNRLLARALRRLGQAAPARETMAILAVSALAADRGEASFLDELTPRSSLRHSLQFVDRLEDEVLALGHRGEATPAELVEAIGRLRRVRTAIEERLSQLPGAALAGVDGLDFLIEFVHDLRSPLGSLQLLADRLQQGFSGPLTPLQQRQLRLMYAAAHALSTVTANALQLTRRWDQLEEPAPRPFSVTRLLSEVQDIVRTLAVQKGLELNFIRPTADRRLGHPVELHRILLNLVTNALKFTPRGSVTVSATDQDDGRMEFAVRDSGPGIDPAVQQTLFQPFRRSAGHATFSATSLGLAISQRLVRALGGHLHYQTAAGAGTRFYFVVALPVA